MIIPNKSVSITRFAKVNWKTTYVDVVWNADVFIEPLSEDVMIWMDWMSAYEWFTMMSHFTEIEIWDKINDWENVYKVKWYKVYDSFIWKHIEAIIQKDYD